MSQPKSSNDQHKRFVEAARRLQTNEEEAEFDRQLKNMGSMPPTKKTKTDAKKTPAK